MTIPKSSGTELHFRVQALCPPFRQRFQKIPGIGHKHSAFNGDHLLNRFWDYPRYLTRKVGEFDLFHIADHSYAHLVHELPGDRRGLAFSDFKTALGSMPGDGNSPGGYPVIPTEVWDDSQSDINFYLDTTDGDDNNDGLTETTPVKTWERAIAIIKQNGFHRIGKLICELRERYKLL